MAGGDDAAEDDFSTLFEQEERLPCRLYLISPPAFSPTDHAAALRDALAADGDVAAYQLRLKGASDEDILQAARLLKPVCEAHDVAFIMNDRADLALKSGADGVHLGREDGSLTKARELLGPEAQIGATCNNSRHYAMEAAEAGANYVAFGAFFPSPTKEASHVADVGILRWWTTLSPIPCVAIGGITPENCRPLVEAGADFLAVSAAVWGRDVAQAVTAFQDVIRQPS